MKRMLLSTVVAAMCLVPLFAKAQETSGKPFGPPAEVIAAWENGEGHLLPGPPAWVLEMRQVRGSAQPQADQSGMPPWVAKRHVMAQQLGLGGPPAEVIEAWQSGMGFDLPGPPEFVLDLMQFVRGE